MATDSKLLGKDQQGPTLNARKTVKSSTKRNRCAGTGKVRCLPCGVCTACARPVRQVPRAARCGCPARQARHRAFRRRIFRADGRCRTEAPAGTNTCRGRDIVDCRRRTAGGGSCGVSRIRPAREYKTAALRGRGRGALTGRFGRARMTRRGVPGGTPLVYL